MRKTITIRAAHLEGACPEGVAVAAELMGLDPERDADTPVDARALFWQLNKVARDKQADLEKRLDACGAALWLRRYVTLVPEVIDGEEATA